MEYLLSRIFFGIAIIWLIAGIIALFMNASITPMLGFSALGILGLAFLTRLLEMWYQ